MADYTLPENAVKVSELQTTECDAIQPSDLFLLTRGDGSAYRSSAVSYQELFERIKKDLDIGQISIIDFWCSGTEWYKIYSNNWCE